MSDIDNSLSVCVRSYNQKDYLKKALDSILSQKTSFDFEIIVSDDCSKDGTVEMLNGYLAKYPNKFRLILGEENIGGPNNFRRVIEASKSKYVAFMDGDDYWVDDYKLQKQYDFMTIHPDFIGCFHNAYKVPDENSKRIVLFNNEFLEENINYEPIIIKHWFMPTSSEFVVRDKIFFPDWYSEVANDDYVVNLGLAMSGSFYYMPDVMSAYRCHEGNVSRIYNDQSILCKNFLKIYKGYSAIYPEKAKWLFEQKIAEYNEIFARYKRLAKHPWLVYLDWRFYKRAIFKALKIRRVAE